MAKSKSSSTKKVSKKTEAQQEIHKTLSTAIGTLAISRDLAISIDKGEGPLCDGDAAMLVEMCISRAGAEIEQTLFNLGLLGDKHLSGYFVDHLDEAGAASKGVEHG